VSDLSADALRALAQAASEDGSIHVDVAPLLGLSSPVRVGVADVLCAVGGCEGSPSLTVEVGSAILSISRQDNGAMAKLAIQF
jgi:hypothetical protein